MGLDTQIWSDQLGMTPQGYGQLRTNPKAVSIDTVLRLSERLDVSFEALITGHIDYSLIAAQQGGQPTALPERYATAAFSKRRTSIHLLEYLSKRYSPELKQHILRHFQLNEAVFSDPDAEISVRFLIDLCAYLRNLGFSEDELLAMGAYSVVTNRNTALAEKLASAASPLELHELFTTDVVSKYYERNFEYRILQGSAHTCIIEVRPRQELVQALGTHKPGNPSLCLLRAGSLATLTGYLHLPFSSIREISCTHRGDSACRYELDFTKAVRLSSQR